MTLNLAETSVVKSRPSVPYGANFILLLIQSVVNVAVSWNRKVHRYSPELIARMPVKFVLQQSQKTPSLYSGVYSPLLR